MNARTRAGGRKGVKIGLGASAVSMAAHGALNPAYRRGWKTQPGLSAGGTVVGLGVNAAAGYGIGAGVSAYKQHRENAHIHNFHTSARRHTM